MHRVVPDLIIESYRAGRFRGEFPAVGMFLDLSGFSTMTDALMQHGQHGAEVLANLMHGVFDPLVESIFNYGGKIVGFAGDGIMALYPVQADTEFTPFRALASAWLIQQRLVESSQRHTIYGNFKFTAKIGLAYGNVSWGILRSEDKLDATYYFRGSAVDGCALAEHHAIAGEILLTDELKTLLGPYIQTKSSGSFHQLRGLGSDLPDATSTVLPPVDIAVSRIFMPEEVISRDARGEFRQIVNLFMRFPEISDEKLEEISRVIFNLRRQYGGLLNRVDFGDKGCNILILWGAPVAYENDIGRALNFILDLQSRVDIPVTAGVTYYIAHAGYLGSVMCEDYTCYGWGVNLASRFMMNAPTGAIWVDERIARRVSSRFAIEYIGSQRFKGFSAEQRVHRLRSYNRNGESLSLGEMIRREGELSQLEKFVEPVWKGDFAGFLLVLGEAGIGKGQLVQGFHFSPLFETQHALWAVCQSEQILRQSFNPFRSWLFQYFGFTTGQDVETRKKLFDAKLDHLLQSIPDTEPAQELRRLRSVLGALVDLYWVDSLHEQLDAEARYNSTLLVLISLIKAESLIRPLILFIEDVQFIDEDSLHFLPRLKHSLMADDLPYPVAMIATSRIESLNQIFESDLADQQIMLRGLPREAVARLVEILLGGVPALALINLVMDRSEGNPYFVEQIIRYLQEESLIEMSADGWKQVELLHQSFLPRDIGALLVARLDQLSRKVKELVQTASVLGREFLLDVLTEMTPDGDAIEQYVIDAEHSMIWSGERDGRYAFTHGLLRDAAYSMQMRARRQELHSLAVQALERVFENELDIHYAELAYHSERAGLREKAIRYHSLAGKAARDAYQNAKGVEYFTRALSLTLEDALKTRFDLLVERIELFNRLGKRDLQLADLNSIQEIAERLQDVNCLAVATMLHSSYSYFVGDFPRAIDLSRRAAEISEPLVNSDRGLYTQVVWFMALLYLGRVDDAMKQARESLERSRRVGNRKEEGRILTAMGLVALESEEPGTALRYLAESVRIAHEINDPSLEIRAIMNLAKAEGSVNGNYARAGELHAESYKLARMVGDRHNESAALINRGFTASMQGNFSSARAYYEQSLSIVREVGSPNLELYCRLNLSALASLQNDAEPALHQAQLALALAQKVSQRSEEAWALLYLGYAYSLQNEFELAKAACQKSLEIRISLNQPAMSMEPIAALLEIYLKADDLDAAAFEAEKILEHLQSGSALDGTEAPLRIYNACYSYLTRIGDPRAPGILAAANLLLEKQVSKFPDDQTRRQYIENIPWRRAIRDAARS